MEWLDDDKDRGNRQRNQMIEREGTERKKQYTHDSKDDYCDDNFM